MNGIFKALSNDESFMTAYWTVAVATLVLGAVLWFASQLFTLRRQAALQMSKPSTHATPTFAASPISKPQPEGPPDDTVWWVAGTVPPTNATVEITHPPLALDESIARRSDVIQRGARIDEATFPTRLTMNTPFDPAAGLFRGGRRLPTFFYQDMFCIAHEAIDIFAAHDLGEAQFRAVDIFEMDGETRIDEPVRILVPGNATTAFSMQHSPEVEKATLPVPELLAAPVASFMMKNGDVAVTRDVLGGPDVWIDPTFRRTFFLSDRMARALREAGLADDFDLRWARLV